METANKHGNCASTAIDNSKQVPVKKESAESTVSQCDDESFCKQSNN